MKTSKGEDRSQPSQGRGSAGGGGMFGWFHAKRPVLGFVVLFVTLMAAFYAVTLYVNVVDKKILPAYMRANATASAAILNLFGEGATARGTAVTSSRYSVDIQHGCDAIEPSALFLAAVLAFPASFRSKLPGLLIGTVVLALMNLVRIVSLFYTGIYWNRWFEVMHRDVWQPVFILSALTFWVIWACWSAPVPRSKAHVAD